MNSHITTKSQKKIKVVAVSGGFDPVHIGHVRMFKEAKKLGTHLVVILNSDEWLMCKKGFSFMPQEERAELIKSFEDVDDVYTHQKMMGDMSVCSVLIDYKMKINNRKYSINVFANGGDIKNKTDIPEANICNEANIEMVFNVGRGGKIQSSSWLTNKLIKR